MNDLLVRIRNEEIEKIKKDEIEKIRNEHLDEIMKDNLDILAANEDHKKKMSSFTDDIIKESIKSEKMNKKINDPKKIQEIKDLINKEQKENNDINEDIKIYFK